MHSQSCQLVSCFKTKKTHQTSPKRGKKKAQPIFSGFFSDFWSDYCFLLHYIFVSYFQDRVLVTLTVLNEKDPGRTWKLRYPKEEQREVVSEPLNLTCHIQPMCSDFPALLITFGCPCQWDTSCIYTDDRSHHHCAIQLHRKTWPPRRKGVEIKGVKGRNSRSTYQSAECLQQFSFQPL